MAWGLERISARELVEWGLLFEIHAEEHEAGEPLEDQMPTDEREDDDSGVDSDADDASDEDIAHMIDEAKAELARARGGT